MHGWLYVEMASLFVSRTVAEFKVVTFKIVRPFAAFLFLSERQVDSSGLI